MIIDVGTVTCSRCDFPGALYSGCVHCSNATQQAFACPVCGFMWATARGPDGPDDETIVQPLGAGFTVTHDGRLCWDPIETDADRADFIASTMLCHHRYRLAAHTWFDEAGTLQIEYLVGTAAEFAAWRDDVCSSDPPSDPECRDATAAPDDWAGTPGWGSTEPDETSWEHSEDDLDDRDG